MDQIRIRKILQLAYNKNHSGGQIFLLAKELQTNSEKYENMKDENIIKLFWV